MAEQAVWWMEQLGTGVLCVAGVLLLVWISSLIEGGKRDDG
jgi:hypothetical protein